MLLEALLGLSAATGIGGTLASLFGGGDSKGPDMNAIMQQLQMMMAPQRQGRVQSEAPVFNRAPNALGLASPTSEQRESMNKMNLFMQYIGFPQMMLMNSMYQQPQPNKWQQFFGAANSILGPLSMLAMIPMFGGGAASMAQGVGESWSAFKARTTPHQRWLMSGGIVR